MEQSCSNGYVSNRHISNGYISLSLYMYSPWWFFYCTPLPPSASHIIMSRRSLLMKQVMDSSSSDDDGEFIVAAANLARKQYQVVNAPRPGGSVPGHQIINRDRQEGHWRLFRDYFSDDSTYDPTFFRCRFVNEAISLEFFVDVDRTYSLFFISKQV